MSDYSWSTRIGYLVIRYWDGYDKPSYSRVLPINEPEEINLDAGRFENFVNRPIQTSKATFDYVTFNDYTLAEFFNWAFENTTGKWSIEVIGTHGYHRPLCGFIATLWFENEADAVAFKLMWQ